MSSIEDDIHSKESKKSRNYEVASISKIEFLIYLTYWFAILLRGCQSVNTLAYRPATLKYFKRDYLVTKTYFGLYQSKFEYVWSNTVSLVNEGFLSFLLYILVSRFLRSKASPQIFISGCLLFTLLLNLHYSSLKFLAFEAMILFIPSMAGLFRSKALVWISALILLYKMKEYIEYEFFLTSYLFSNSYPYTALLVTRAITVGLVIADSPKYDLKLFLELNFYYWYYPAIIGCRMMTLKDFVAQIYEPYVIKKWKSWLFLAFRVAFWYCIWSIVSALVPFYLVFITHDIKSFDIFVVTGGQLFYGIHFCMVYVILYNAVYLVTQLDGFLTAEGPECICHIALYNRMWRTFDVGLHIWIKEYIFRPIIKLGDFRKTKIVATIASFGFIIVFHGLKIDTVLWIFLNVMQYFVHDNLVYGFNNYSWGLAMQRRFSPAWNRRIIAIAGAFSWLTSIYGFGTFSYGFEKNNEMYMSFFKRNFNDYYYRAVMFAILCYCHSQICLTINAYLERRKEKVQ